MSIPPQFKKQMVKVDKTEKKYPDTKYPPRSKGTLLRKAK